jgi:hypothetical protein
MSLEPTNQSFSALRFNFPFRSQISASDSPHEEPPNVGWMAQHPRELKPPRPLGHRMSRGPWRRHHDLLRQLLHRGGHRLVPEAASYCYLQLSFQGNMGPCLLPSLSCQGIDVLPWTGPRICPGHATTRQQPSTGTSFALDFQPPLANARIIPALDPRSSTSYRVYNPASSPIFEAAKP